MGLDKDPLSVDQIQKALGASHVLRLENLPSQGPLDLLQLREELRRRLRSSGGRPTDPEWSVRRVIPFKQDYWRELELLASECQGAGQNVSAGQIAAILIERALNEIRKTRARKKFPSR